MVHFTIFSYKNINSIIDIRGQRLESLVSYLCWSVWSLGRWKGNPGQFNLCALVFAELELPGFFLLPGARKEPTRHNMAPFFVCLCAPKAWVSQKKQIRLYLGNSQRKCPFFVILSVDVTGTGYTWANSHGIFLDDPDSENTTNWSVKVKRAKNLSRLRLFTCRVRKHLSSSPASFPIQIKGLEKKKLARSLYLHFVLPLNACRCSLPEGAHDMRQIRGHLQHNSK